MSINKDLLNADIKNQIDILRYESRLTKDVDSILKELEKDLIKKIKNGKLKSGRQKQRFNKLLNETTALIESQYVNINTFTYKENIELIRYQSDYFKNTLDKSVGFTFANKLTLDKAKKIAKSKLIMGSKSETWWKKQGKKYNKRFEQQMKLGLLENETIGELTTRFRRNVSSIQRKQAKSLVRTSVIEFSNTSKMETYKANDDVIAGIQWLSTLDNRTTVICISLDGLIWDNNLKPVGHSTTYPGNTAHWGCRSTQLAVTRSFDNIRNPKLKEKILVNGKKVEFAGKPTPHKKFETWLRERPVEEQNDILGMFKAEQWRKGNIKSLRDLTNQRSRPLTIKELRKKYDIKEDE